MILFSDKMSFGKFILLQAIRNASLHGINYTNEKYWNTFIIRKEGHEKMNFYCHIL